VQDCGGSDYQLSDELLNSIDYLSPNETELLRITGEKYVDPEITRSKLGSKHPNLKLLLKKGSKGCEVLTNVIHVKSEVVTHHNPKILDDYKILDTCGAGDCHQAAFFARYLEVFTPDNKETDDIKYLRCMNFANAAAFLSICKKGAMPSNPKVQVVKDFIAKYLGDLQC